MRFFGGFSFRADHRPGGPWSAFPSGLFHLPEFELEREGAGDLELRGRAIVDEARDPEEVRQELEQRLIDLRGELAFRSPETQRPRVVRANRVATDRTSWEGAVVEVLAAIRLGRVSKVVLARTLDVTPEDPVDPVDVVLRLWDANRGTHVFLFEPEAGSALIGAAPETVATLRNGTFQATAVAGSIRRGDDPDEQAALAATLLASHKDREEQRIALDDMVERLTDVATQIRMDAEPHVLALTRIQHLETVIRARVNNGRDVLDLVRLLHPTPAVCGLPRDAALELLAREEPFDRGWYAGPVGWFDGEGNGIFAPALRMAVLHGGTWRLFAGAGIVEESMPALEWEETGMKFEPVLRALAAAGVALSDREEPVRSEERRG
jgi:menaquinone-specific isochorismate synthase